MAENTALTPEQKLFAERLNRMETAIGLGEPDRVPVAPLYRFLRSAVPGILLRRSLL